jgi:glycosyltransferase involved in cell wall biosynthesis
VRPAVDWAPGPTVLLVQTAMPYYRQAFVAELQRRLGGRATIMMGEDHFDGTSRAGVVGRSVRIGPRNRFLADRRLLWQRDVVRASLGPDVVVHELNPRVLSTWCTLLARRALGRPTVLWGHAWGRGGPAGRTEPLRHAMRMLADALIVYTAAQRRELGPRLPGKLVVAAPNALYHEDDMRPTGGAAAGLLWVGRLVAEKKPDLAVRGFHAALDRLPVDCRLWMVGAGPAERRVRDLVEELGLGERVSLVGEVSDLGRLRTLFDDAVASISTGYVGLNMIQSHSFGVPMVYADAEPHAPEIDVANGRNSRPFRSDDVHDLADVIVETVGAADLWRARRGEIAAGCRRHHSVEAMVDGFLDAVTAVAAGRRPSRARTGAG